MLIVQECFIFETFILLSIYSSYEFILDNTVDIYLTIFGNHQFGSISKCQ